MALKGKAKKAYQREYMKDYMRKRRGLNNGVLTRSKQGFNKPDLETKLKQSGLIMRGNQIINAKRGGSPSSKPDLPVYMPGAHYEAGEHILVRRGKKYIEFVVPELDGDGHPIPSLT